MRSSARRKPPAPTGKCRCPFCDEVLGGPDAPFCQPCGLRFAVCRGCGQPVVEGEKTCPRCGALVSKPEATGNPR